MSENRPTSFTCPLPIDQYPTVTLPHGGGGKLMNQLISEMFLKAFQPDETGQPHDGAVNFLGDSRFAFTTDSYVVRPLFFPGGDIGSLAVHGTVNDLAMCGARPLFLSASFILEEGFPMDLLWRVVQSMKAAADGAGVRIVTGDTKVVDRGKGDGIYINTAGVGELVSEDPIAPESIREGDVLILSGDLGRHGISIMTLREGLAFETKIESDSAPLVEPVMDLIESGVAIHCLRDLTRGGLVSALNELAMASRKTFHIREKSIPVSEPVHSACEILGLDPLSVANEGRFVAFAPASEKEKCLEILQSHPVSADAREIGTVVSTHPPLVTLETPIGVTRILPMPSGEQLPRIC
ncbi:MAG: hydrogenase expression/formation protein HypE [Candidatus Omnitrophica bacterium]|nr:hydrogenase expression/formation protein HypE [Candidatus Omnitrophota bacterium]MCA9425688.1 hydrogenase expression/formation protein HypE [Candidatus Omnitrophota bacterium]MCA9434689.1 hydrogenase expression/formation protein HypE [Candidatus Omnitrophota bacterium]